MKTSGMSVDEMTESLTGFDEIAIEKVIGIDPYIDGERKPVLVMRALVFVHLRRQGSTDAEAKQSVMEMSVKAINDYFEDDDEVSPDEPVTTAGKDVSAPA